MGLKDGRDVMHEDPSSSGDRQTQQGEGLQNRAAKEGRACRCREAAGRLHWQQPGGGQKKNKVGCSYLNPSGNFISVQET